MKSKPLFLRENVSCQSFLHKAALLQKRLFLETKTSITWCLLMKIVTDMTSLRASMYMLKYYPAKLFYILTSGKNPPGTFFKRQLCPWTFPPEHPKTFSREGTWESDSFRQFKIRQDTDFLDVSRTLRCKQPCKTQELTYISFQ